MAFISRKFRENRCVNYEYAHVLDKIGVYDRRMRYAPTKYPFLISKQ